MPQKTIPTDYPQASDVPADDADLEDLFRFALSFDGYRRWGSFSRCAEIANARDHGSLDKLRTCLFFEARRWHHFGDSPDEEETRYWRSLVAEIRLRLLRLDSLSPQWLAQTIERLPPDEAVPDNTPGYNVYNTQRAHWLGWLDPAAGTGTYARSTRGSVSARTVYQRIGEPRMLLWLAEAAGVDPELLQQARESAAQVQPLASQCAAIRKHIPWRTLAEALESSLDSPRRHP